MTENKFNVLSSMVDLTRCLSIPSIFRLFQDNAMLDADKIGGGKDKTLDRDWLWIFTRVFIEIDDLPTYHSIANFITYPNGSKSGFLFYRQALITSNEKVLVKISSQWTLIDAKTRKLVVKSNLPYVDEKTIYKPLDLPNKVISQQSKFLYSRIIRYSDCDLNYHLNNVKYIEFIVDINSNSFYKDYRIHHLLINFKHEVHDGEQIDIYVNDEKTYVEGKVNNVTCFEATLDYKRR